MSPAAQDPMWVSAAGIQLRWYTCRRGPEVSRELELQFRERLAHVNGWERDKWSDWKAVPIVSEAGLHSK